MRSVKSCLKRPVSRQVTKYRVELETMSHEVEDDIGDFVGDNLDSRSPLTLTAHVVVCRSITGASEAILKWGGTW